MKLLVVDDHPIVRSALRRLLAGRAMDIREAASGPEALDAFREFGPDLVLMDLNLPGMSGFEVIRRLKTENAHARILVLSMHDSPRSMSRALHAGAGGYITKDAPPDRILAALDALARGPAYQEERVT
ncbi:MAG TPA: response regulator transcription factor [Alphaproteobacteria bacterium]|nr:response regulator transcription factor [Alphaproteobacteria bacterium]